MSTFPFTRTHSENSFSIRKSDQNDCAPFALSHNGRIEGKNDVETDQGSSLTSPRITSPPSRFKTIKSFNAVYNRGSITSESSDEVLFPFPTSNPTILSEGDLSPNFGDLRLSPFPSPVIRSQSAITNNMPMAEFDSTHSSLFSLAVKRPPARFNPTKNENHVQTLDPSVSIRSLPTSRCNSNEFERLMNDAALLNAELQSDSKSQHLRKSDLKSDLSSFDKKSEGFSSKDSFPIQDPKDVISNEDYRASSGTLAEYELKGRDEHNYQGRELYLVNNNSVSEFPSFQSVVQTSPSFKKDLFQNNSGRNLYGSLSVNPSSFNKFNNRRNLTSVSSKTPMPCRYFQNGGCFRGDQCKFLHTVVKHPDFTLETNLYEEYLDQRHLAQTSNRGGLSPFTKPTALKTSRNFTTSSFKPSIKSPVEVEKPGPSQTDPRFIGKDLKYFAGGLYELCKDQNGCRFLQKHLEDDDISKIQLIFEEVSRHFAELMMDPFGNYLCQKLIEVSNPYQLTRLMDAASLSLVKIAFSLHGTRSIQKMIENLSTFRDAEIEDAVQILVNSFEGHVVALIQDLNGNHVIQKCINLFSPQFNQFIFDAICNNCITVAKHKHGCCVIQRCLDKALEKQRNQLAIVITQNALPLVQDPYGNYVVQHVIDLCNPAYTTGLIANFLGHIRHLSVQKYSSNVIEMCIRKADPTFRHQILNEIIGSEDLGYLIDHSYANYVVQTCLDCAEYNQREMLVYKIRPLLTQLKHSPHIKGIQSRLFSRDARTRRKSSNYDQVSQKEARNKSQSFNAGQISPFKGRHL